MSQETTPQTPFALLQKTHDLMQEIYISLRQYPRSERYVLAADTKRVFCEFLELVIRIKDKHTKRTSIEDADIKLDSLRQYILLGQEFGFMPFKRYEIMSKRADECGRIIGGLMRKYSAH
jgi:hypothetical protein